MNVRTEGTWVCVNPSTSSRTNTRTMLRERRSKTGANMCSKMEGARPCTTMIVEVNVHENGKVGMCAGVNATTERARTERACASACGRMDMGGRAQT